MGKYRILRAVILHAAIKPPMVPVGVVWILAALGNAAHPLATALAQTFQAQAMGVIRNSSGALVPNA